MRSIFAICLSVLFFAASPAFAEDAGRDTICRLLPQYKPVADVEYKAGVDVQGNPVVGADLGAPLKPLDGPAVVIPVDINLASRFNVALPAGAEIKPAIAALKIYADGRVEYNGQDISGQVHDMCSQPAQAAPAAVEGFMQPAVAPPAATDPVIVIAPEDEASAPPAPPAPANPPEAAPVPREKTAEEVQGPPAPLLLHPGVPAASERQNL